MASQALGDVLAGAFGHGVDRPALQSFVANSQATNGLRSAQTEEAMNNAQQQQEEMEAQSQVESGIGGIQGNDGKPLFNPSQAHIMAVEQKAKYGSFKDVVQAMRDAQVAHNTAVASDPNMLNTPDATAAIQGNTNKLAGPAQVPNEYALPAGVAPPTVLQTPLGAAQTAAAGANAELHTAQAANPAAFHPGAGAAAPLSQQAIDLMGDRFFETGQLPSTGMGNAGMELRKQILQSATARATGQRGPLTDQGGQGASAAIIGNAATAGAGKSVVTDMSKRAAIADSSEQTAANNLQLAASYLTKADQTGSPIINTIQNKIRSGVLGDPDVSVYTNALETASNEYARVISMATGASGITDAARAEGQRLFNPNMAPAQLQSNIQVALQEMNNRTGSLHDQIATARKGLFGGPQAPPPGTSLPNPANPADPGPNAGVVPDGTTAINRQTGVRMIRKGGIWQLVQ
jgi:hypothetical protein